MITNIHFQKKKYSCYLWKQIVSWSKVSRSTNAWRNFKVWKCVVMASADLFYNALYSLFLYIEMFNFESVSALLKSFKIKIKIKTITFKV